MVSIIIVVVVVVIILCGDEVSAGERARSVVEPSINQNVFPFYRRKKK